MHMCEEQSRSYHEKAYYENQLRGGGDKFESLHWDHGYNQCKYAFFVCNIVVVSKYKLFLHEMNLTRKRRNM